MTLHEMLSKLTSQDIADVLWKMDLAISGSKADRISRLIQYGGSVIEVLESFRVVELRKLCSAFDVQIGRKWEMVEDLAELVDEYYEENDYYEEDDYEEDVPKALVRDPLPDQRALLLPAIQGGAEELLSIMQESRADPQVIIREVEKLGKEFRKLLTLSQEDTEFVQYNWDEFRELLSTFARLQTRANVFINSEQAIRGAGRVARLFGFLINVSGHVDSIISALGFGPVFTPMVKILATVGATITKNRQLAQLASGRSQLALPPG